MSLGDELVIFRKFIKFIKFIVEQFRVSGFEFQKRVAREWSLVASRWVWHAACAL